MKKLLSAIVISTAFLLVTGLPALAQDGASSRNIIRDVRNAIAQSGLVVAERLLNEYRAAHGNDPEALEALSWLGRGALGQKELDAADRYARETYKLVEATLKSQPLDADRWRPIALGAAIEVQAQSLAQRDRRSEAVYFLQREIEKWKKTSILMRLQKNMNLLTLEGKPAPALTARTFIGPAGRGSLASPRGRPALMFFWAHWCGDCKVQGPILEKLMAKYKDSGLVLVGPTQRYGYIKAGTSASSGEELQHIEAIRQKHYAALDMAVPVSEDDFIRYGVSTTPTIVLVDAEGIVRLYNPGRMTEEALDEKLRLLIGATSSVGR